MLGSLSVSAQTSESGSNSKKTAQAPAGFSGISGSNSKKPIDIDSDRLEVDDKKQTAIFIGNVSATQGDYNLRSPRLEVTYEHSAAAGSAPAGQGKAPRKLQSLLSPKKLPLPPLPGIRCPVGRLSIFVRPEEKFS